MITSLNGTPLSSLTFGTMQFGGKADEDASRAMFDLARDHGITHFDTAWVYTDGTSERLLGKFINGNRDDLIIATKCAYTGGAGRENILSQVGTSRQRMQLDTLDILYLHRFDPETDLRQSFDALASLQAAGTIRYIGLSNFAAWQVAKAQWIASQFDTRVDIVQPMYNLVKRQAEVEIFPACEDLGIEIAPYSPLGGGLLTGKYAAGETGRLSEDERYGERYGLDWMHQAARDLTELARNRNETPASLAVAWAMAHPCRPHPIISARSVEQLLPSLAAKDIRMTPDLYAEIAALSRTPPPATDRLEEA